MLRWSLAIVVVLGVAAGVVIGALNPARIELDLAILQWTASLGTVLVATFSVGFLGGLLAFALLRIVRAPGRSKPASTHDGSVGKRLDNA